MLLSDVQNEFVFHCQCRKLSPKTVRNYSKQRDNGAEIGFYYYQLSQSGMSEPKIGVREITQAMSSGYDSYSSWIKTRSWNTKPAISDDYMDYVVMPSDKVESWVSWDITRSVKKWYADSSTNYGLAFDLTDAVYQSHARAEAAVQNHGYCDGFLRL